MTRINPWARFADRFEEKNNYVVGVGAVQDIQRHLSTYATLGRVLELGCGNGTYTSSLLAASEHITATDLSGDMVAVTAKRFADQSGVTVAVADCHALSYPSHSFDTVLMANLLHIIPQRERALEEVARVLKPGGRLLLISFTIHGMSALEVSKMMYRYTRTYGRKSGDNITLTPDLARQLLADAGFEDASLQLLGDKVKAVVGDATRPA